MVTNLQLKQLENGMWLVIEPSAWISLKLHRDLTLREMGDTNVGYTFDTATEAEYFMGLSMKVMAIKAIQDVINANDYDETSYDDIINIMEKLK